VFYAGADAQTNGVIIDVHGGGYCFWGAGLHIQYAEWLSKSTGCTVLCLDYKLAPEYPLPYAVNELLALYEYVLTDLRVPADKIAMSGGSAGGGMILLTLQELARRQEQKSEVCYFSF
jgi:acetyl esterase